MVGRKETQLHVPANLGDTMSRLKRFVLACVCVVGVAGLAALILLGEEIPRTGTANALPAPEGPAFSRPERMRAAAPHYTEEELAQLMAESDAINELVSSREPRTQTRYLLHAMERLPISEEEARAYHAAHPEVFGTRPFESSRLSIERILRSRQIRSGHLPSADEWSWPKTNENARTKVNGHLKETTENVIPEEPNTGGQE